MQSDGLKLLGRHGFRPVGPWLVNIGKWSEVSYLFRFDSLRERDELIASFARQDDGRKYGAKLSEFADEVTTRILVPASFAHPASEQNP